MAQNSSFHGIDSLFPDETNGCLSAADGLIMVKLID
jgi:hypothetical protein